MGFSLKNILNDARQLDQAAAAQVNPFDHGATFNSVRQEQHQQQQAQAPHAPYPSDILRAAMLKQNLNDLPLDNLDGTFTGQKPGSTIMQTGGTWQPPLLPGNTTPRGVSFYDPSGQDHQDYTNDSYYALPINPNIVPRPMQPLRQMMLPGSN